MKTCDAPSCAKKRYSGGLCVAHFKRMRRYGSLELPAAPTPAERLASLVVIHESGCHLWQGAPAKNGYGVISIENRDRYAHRLAYEVLRGPIPDGLTIDHLCRVRLCVNVDHLELVTRAENTRRELAFRYAEPATHCSKGHSLCEGNVYLRSNGRPRCRTCVLDRNADRRASLRTEAAA